MTFLDITSFLSIIINTGEFQQSCLNIMTMNKIYVKLHFKSLHMN